MGRPSPLQRVFRRVYGWAAERLYHELAWAYEAIAWLVSLGRWDAWRRQVLDHVVGQRLLEVGFGTGKLLLAAASVGYDVVGIDPSWEMQRVASRTLGDKARSVPRLRAPAQALPFPNEAFDTVLVTFPTQYALDPATLREVRRVLRSRVSGDRGGRIVMTGLGVRAERSWSGRILDLVFGAAQGDVVAEYRAFAQENGFDGTIVEDEAAATRVPVLVLEKIAGNRTSSP